MGIWGWLAENSFNLLSAVGIIGGLCFTAHSLRSETKTRRIANLLALTAAVDLSESLAPVRVAVQATAGVGDAALAGGTIPLGGGSGLSAAHTPSIGMRFALSEGSNQPTSP